MFVKNSRKSWFYRQLLTATLIINSTFQLAAPVLAEGTAANTQISNTATATYQDSNNPRIPISITSNTITITIAEVAGITVTNSGVEDVNGDILQPNDVVNYDFTVINTGNDSTKFFIPGAPSKVTNGTAGTLLADLDNDGTFETSVPAKGLTTLNAIPARGQIKVRVPVTVGAAAAEISVVLGDTGDNISNTQNQPDAADGSNANEVRTVDADPGTPANGEREASASQQSTVSTQSVLGNGPESQLEALGIIDNNDDFTIGSTELPASLSSTDTFDPAPVNFTNTLENRSTANSLTVSLLPTPPTNAATLPNGTLVTISSNGESATYEYNNGVFTFVSGTGTSATDPIENTLAPSTTANYTVTVDLPDNTPQLTGYQIPILAFIDTNNNGTIDSEETIRNITIEKLYTGFLKVVKESRILQGTGPDVLVGQETFSTNPKTPKPGNIIEYRITYTNISEPGSSNDQSLYAENFVITEDGTTNTSNWAKDNDGNGTLDTSNVVGSATDPGGTITFTPADQTGTTAETDVTRYVDTVINPVGPGQSGTFTFQRRVN